jgi:hypothetical protein
MRVRFRSVHDFAHESPIAHLEIRFDAVFGVRAGSGLRVHGSVGEDVVCKPRHYLP